MSENNERFALVDARIRTYTGKKDIKLNITGDCVIRDFLHIIIIM